VQLPGENYAKIAQLAAERPIEYDLLALLGVDRA
jgi:hypothetical protein